MRKMLYGIVRNAIVFALLAIEVGAPTCGRGVRLAGGCPYNDGAGDDHPGGSLREALRPLKGRGIDRGAGVAVGHGVKPFRDAV